MTAHDHTPPVTYRQLDRILGYRFGDDGSVWSRRKCCRWDQFTSEWRPVHTRRKQRCGHLTIRVSIDGAKINYFVHRLILEAFVGPCPPGMECCHNDGDPTNNRLDNLRWDTSKANSADSARHGTMRRAKGSKHYRAKLTEADIPVIRELHREGMSSRQIAERFGVSHRMILLIVRGEAWKHV